MAAAAAAAAATTEQQYSNEDWQAQLEEVLALQSIYAEDFRVIHIPGCAALSSAYSSGSSSALSGSDGGQSSGGVCISSTGYEQIEDLEQQLQSLLGSEPPTCSTTRGLITCEAVVHVELPAGQLRLVLDTQNSNMQQGSNGSSHNCHLQDKAASATCSTSSCNSSSNSRMPFGPPVQYLPPIRVQLSLPVSYPSRESSPPIIDLQACWLAGQHVQQLKQLLQDIWIEQGPGPVCFAWLDFIKESGLERLGIVKELVLQPQPAPQSAELQGAAAATASCTQKQEHRASAAEASAHTNSIASGSNCTRSGGDGSLSQTINENRQGAGLSAAAAPFKPSGSSSSGRARQRQQGRVSPRQQQQQQQQEWRRKGEWVHKHPAVEKSAQQPLQTSTGQRTTQREAQHSSQQHQQQQQQHPEQQQHKQQQCLLPPSVEQVAVQLLRYSAVCEAEAFKATLQTCNICFEQVPGCSCLLLPDCGHFYCTDCLRSAAAAQMELGALDNMRCPEPSCRRPLPPYVIKELLGEAGYAKWEEQLLQRTLDRMEDVVYCPRCDAVCIEDKDHCAQCGNCLYVFCSFCHDSWHPGTECLDPHERLRVLERRKKATGAGDKRHEMDLINQAMNLKYLTSCSKKCPSCGMATIKNEGCNKMTCVYCRANWCWKCQQVIEGYDHFRDSRCNMFDQEEINRWNTLMWQNERAQEVEMGQIMIQVRRDMAPGAMMCRCPVCGQENLREGRNNLLRCWSCNCHFCYSCRSWLRGKVGQHYIGKGACKQHGD